MTITVAQLQSIAAAWQNALNQLNALILANNTTPPGTTVTGPNSATLTDAQGKTFSLAGPSGGFFSVLVNGSPVGAVQSLTIDINGVMWGLCPSVAWFQWSGSGWVNKGSTAPVTS